MHKFFIILMIALVGFIIWCAKTQQPRETQCLNIMSLVMAVHLARFHSKKKT